jgi:hypothetical protein
MLGHRIPAIVTADTETVRLMAEEVTPRLVAAP